MANPRQGREHWQWQEEDDENGYCQGKGKQSRLADGKDVNPSQSPSPASTHDATPGALAAASVNGDLPSGETPGLQAAEVLEDLPSGKRSRTEAKEEDVEMGEAREEGEEASTRRANGRCR